MVKIFLMHSLINSELNGSKILLQIFDAFQLPQGLVAFFSDTGNEPTAPNPIVFVGRHGFWSELDYCCEFLGCKKVLVFRRFIGNAEAF